MKLSYLGLRRLSRILGPLRASGMVPAVVDDVLGRRVESAAQDIGIDVGIDEPQQAAIVRVDAVARFLDPPAALRGRTAGAGDIGGVHVGGKSIGHQLVRVLPRVRSATPGRGSGVAKATSNAKEPREIRCRVLAAVAAAVVMIAGLCRAGQPAMSSKTQAKNAVFTYRVLLHRSIV